MGVWKGRRGFFRLILSDLRVPHITSSLISMNSLNSQLERFLSELREPLRPLNTSRTQIFHGTPRTILSDRHGSDRKGP
ncbi:hypothetical protein RCIA33 [Methanocella arvoryzae MRE50]|uniref:Uncharacterized protein n=1 Tax=Methanocella arvoryzae (strain DSM 22066 / NBRC 105507 / MRE50) TaxID=351160 RepID=Q0W690_METAR|nr:hypothetical protein orf11 [uncultured archaeon]CAJ36103.1 hypothetical protein RCIA33 [Methanocella arvoryzae MRE50]